MDKLEKVIKGMDAINEFKHTMAGLCQIPYDVLFPGERTDETLEKTKIAPPFPALDREQAADGSRTGGNAMGRNLILHWLDSLRVWMVRRRFPARVINRISKAVKSYEQ